MPDVEVSGKRVLVLVPHQDDEVIGMGGMVAKACLDASSVHVVLVTDGGATGSARCLIGERPCRRFSELFQGNEECLKHDSSLTLDEDGALYHSKMDESMFDLQEDSDRSGGFASPGWGKQRDREFQAVCLALGVKAENIVKAYWDPDSPHSIKDGQVALDGRPFSNDERKERYRKVARHYMEKFRPEVVYTMAPYEFSEPPNDHWAVAVGVREASETLDISEVLYFHSGRHYRHVAEGSEPMGHTCELEDGIWEIKKKAIEQYLRWDPDDGWFATAVHSVPEVFATLLEGHGRSEYFSRMTCGEA